MKLRALRQKIKGQSGLEKHPGRRFFKKGDEHRERSQWAEAAASYAAGLAVEPEAFAIWVQLGHALKEQGQFHQAEAAYLRAAVLYPDDADLHVHLGHLYRILDDRPRFRSHYEKAVTSGAVDIHVFNALADDARDRGDWQSAAKWYRKSAELDPSDAHTWTQCAVAFQNSGQLQLAREAFLRAQHLEMKSSNVEPDARADSGLKPDLAESVMVLPESTIVLLERLLPAPIDRRDISEVAKSGSFASIILKALREGEQRSLSNDRNRTAL